MLAARLPAERARLQRGPAEGSEVDWPGAHGGQEVAAGTGHGPPTSARLPMTPADAEQKALSEALRRAKFKGVAFGLARARNEGGL